jgi:VanZ family protein
MMQILKSFWKTFTWTGIVIFLSLLSGNEVEKIPLPQIPHFDKYVHFTMYFIFTFLLLWDFSRYNYKSASWKRIVFFSILMAVILGGSMELLQGIHRLHRSTDIKDFIANSAGALTAVFLFKFLENFLLKIILIIKPKSRSFL